MCGFGEGNGLSRFFLSTTARLSAAAPFQVLSDGRYILLLRQSVEESHQDAVFHTPGGVVSGDRAAAAVGSKQAATAVADRVLLCDRFVLAGSAPGGDDGFTVEAWIKPAAESGTIVSQPAAKSPTGFTVALSADRKVLVPSAECGGFLVGQIGDRRDVPPGNEYQPAGQVRVDRVSDPPMGVGGDVLTRAQIVEAGLPADRSSTPRARPWPDGTSLPWTAHGCRLG
ncbi:hypothetical protein [Embleya sp. NPDC020630]|uniref:hypothetical protein n=1 Tax=Embleya sp. NPDC020630 TaxID=3363979 RepID=UPI00379A04BD